jgi:hypothetical protein
MRPATGRSGVSLVGCLLLISECSNVVARSGLRQLRHWLYVTEPARFGKLVRSENAAVGQEP